MHKRPASQPKDLRPTKSLENLIEIVAALRGPEGCPWDKAQTHNSLTPYTIEECFELVEAIEGGNPKTIKDELGDVLFQVLLHAQLAEEKNRFNFDDVVLSLSEKLIRRHPHVFADIKADSIEEVWKNWDSIKKKEKQEQSQKASRLDVPAGLPALQRAGKLGHRTKKLKFDWQNVDQVLEKLNEELSEFRQALTAHQSLAQDSLQNSTSSFAKSKESVESELGDIFFTLAQVCRHLEIEPEQATRNCNRRFENRFELMMQFCERDGRLWEELSPADRENYWSEAKSFLSTKNA